MRRRQQILPLQSHIYDMHEMHKHNVSCSLYSFFRKEGAVRAIQQRNTAYQWHNANKWSLIEEEVSHKYILESHSPCKKVAICSLQLFTDNVFIGESAGGKDNPRVIAVNLPAE